MTGLIITANMNFITFPQCKYFVDNKNNCLYMSLPLSDLRYLITGMAAI